VNSIGSCSRATGFGRSHIWHHALLLKQVTVGSAGSAAPTSTSLMGITLLVLLLVVLLLPTACRQCLVQLVPQSSSC
jgi:hypothetical protein